MDGRDARAGGHEAAAQIGKVGEFTVIEDGIERAGEIGFVDLPRRSGEFP